MNKVNSSLYIVSTPIGNLEDITLRALKVLRSVHLILVENIKHSKALLNYYDIKCSLLSYNEHNSTRQIPKVIRKLIEGKNIAIISDAGTPGISDPGYKLVRASIDRNIKIIPVPGASAVTAGLVASGLPTDRFLFEGFLPPKKGRAKKIKNLSAENATLIFYESPKRLIRTLNDIYQNFGERPCVVCRELTKIYEEFIRGSLSYVIDLLSKRNSIKGECVILIGKNEKNVFF